MKQISLFKFAISTIVVFSGVLNPLFSQDLFETDKIALSEAKRYDLFKNATFKGAPQAANYDVIYNRLIWEVNPSIKYIKGEVTTHFIPLTTNFNEIYFDLSYSLTVDSVKYRGAVVTFNHFTNNTLRLNLPTILPQNTLDSVTVFYHGVPPTTINDAFTQTTHASQPIIFTLSEPFGAFEWWPCKDGLSDKIDSLDIIVTTPKQYKVASQGLLINKITLGANTTYYWKHHYPIATYLISLAITNYSEFTIYSNLSQGTLPIQNFVYPEDSATAYNEIGLVDPIMKLYDTLFIPYPFINEKYGHAQFGWGGGMEHQTIASMGDFSTSLMAHELAHQWFGDRVTCDSWSEIWLNEGFATFCTGLYYKFVDPTWFNPWKLDMINSVTAQPGGSVYNSDTTNISRIFSSRLSYKKGAYLLRMLEWKVGGNNFYQGVKNYLNDVSLAYDFSSTDNLKNHLEVLSGINLTEFFNDWYFGQGYPSYQLTWSQSGSNVYFVVNQTQSHSSVGFYEMPIPIYVKGAGMDTTLVFDHTFSGQMFSASIPFTVDSVFFDPELWILSKNNTITLGINDLNEFATNVELFPNPTNNRLTVKTIENVNKLTVFDVLGNAIYVNQIKQSLSSTELDLSKLKSGFYTIEIEFQKGVIRKVISKL